MNFLRLCLAVFLLGSMTFLQAIESPKTPEDASREAAIAEFTQRMKAANYPALFDQAAAEFRVPADILKGVAFAETRWEHLTWPPGETASPETGMPRPYGIMSLWDNQYFGHSLIEAANLIGKDPEVLKVDPLQNIRGAAALIRRIYDETEKPPGSTEKEVESWRYAIRKYSGIPQQDLNAQHALDVYGFMSRGYHEFGIEWPGQPVNLEALREETHRIVEAEAARKLTLKNGNTNSVSNGVPGLVATIPSNATVTPLTNAPSETGGTPKPVAQGTPSYGRNRGLILLIVSLFLILLSVCLTLRKRNK